jgi:hypothetical protein
LRPAGKGNGGDWRTKISFLLKRTRETIGNKSTARE